MNIDKQTQLSRHIGRRAAARGVTLVEVLIVITIMALITGAASFALFPYLKESRIKTAAMGCQTIRQAAELHQNLEGGGDSCPSVQDLVNGKRIDSRSTDDPWNRPYRIVCEGGDVHVYSNGNDGKENTPDDIRDDFRAADIKRVKDLK